MKMIFEEGKSYFFDMDGGGAIDEGVTRADDFDVVAESGEGQREAANHVS